MSSKIRVRAFAKINWALEILGRRPDGYHEIRTVTHTVSLADEVGVAQRSGGDALLVDSPWDLPTGGENLCLQAVAAFRSLVGGPEGVRVTLRKAIPPASGLGGGSSDAVATLVAMARLMGLGDSQRLEQLAIGLGSDTALFLKGGAALCSGRGEQVTAVACPRCYHLTLARPECSIPTKDAYALLGPEVFSDGSRAAAVAQALAAGAAPKELAPLLGNAFEAPVSAAWPEVGILLAQMRDVGAVASRLTGSGSAVYGLAEDWAQAERMASELGRRGYWVAAVKTVPIGYRVLEEADG